jgi:surface protein
MSGQTMNKLFCLTTVCLSLSSSFAFTPATKQELSTAVRLWRDNSAKASQTYGDISHWNVSKVTDMSGLFYRVDLTWNDTDLSAWDVSKVTNMNAMFMEAYLRKSNKLGKWDVSKVTVMSSMFAHCYSCNPDLSMWNVSSVTDMAGMFVHTTASHNLSKWDVSKVVHMNGMFDRAYGNFGDLAKWDVSNTKNFALMFLQVGPKGDLSTWNVSKDARVDGMFGSSNCEGEKQNLPWSMLVNAQVKSACWLQHEVSQDRMGSSPLALV